MRPGCYACPAQVQYAHPWPPTRSARGTESLLAQPLAGTPALPRGGLSGALLLLLLLLTWPAAAAPTQVPSVLDTSGAASAGLARDTGTGAPALRMHSRPAAAAPGVEAAAVGVGGHAAESDGSTVAQEHWQQ